MHCQNSVVRNDHCTYSVIELFIIAFERKIHYPHLHILRFHDISSTKKMLNSIDLLRRNNYISPARIIASKRIAAEQKTIRAMVLTLCSLFVFISCTSEKIPNPMAAMPIMQNKTFSFKVSPSFWQIPICLYLSLSKVYHKNAHVYNINKLYHCDGVVHIEHKQAFLQHCTSDGGESRSGKPWMLFDYLIRRYFYNAKHNTVVE